MSNTHHPANYKTKGRFEVEEGGFMETVGMNRLFMAKGALESTQGVSEVGSVVNSFWNQDYQGFSHVGAGIHGIASGGINIAGSIMFGLGAHANMSSEGFEFRGERIGARTVIKEGGFIEKGSSGSEFWLKHSQEVNGKSAQGYINSDTKTFMTEEAMTKAGTKLKPTTLFSNRSPLNLAAGAREAEAAGMGAEALLSGGFRAAESFDPLTKGIRAVGGLKGGLAIAAATIVASMAIGKVTSTAGNLLDEAHLAYQQGKYTHYDTRDFNNKAMQNWGMQAGNAMGSYEMNNMSIARAYHSRG